MLFKLVSVFVYLSFIDTSLVFAQNCGAPCIKIDDCPAALTMLNNAGAQDLLRSAFCGFSSDAARRPTVCCSKLSSIEDHPNMRLLPDSCGLIDQERIIGGNETGLYEFPWMVLLSYSTRDGLKFQCGGSLINDRYILTAAHCIVGLKLAGARIGEHDIRTPTDCQGTTPPIPCESNLQDIRIEEQIPHEQYSPKPRVRNDIGLLRLRRPVDFTPRNARPICLPTSSDLRTRNLGGINATVAGWGAVEDGNTSPVLLKVYVPVHTDSDCKGFYNRGKPVGSDETDKKLCAGQVGKDSCGGDSGGPLMVPGTHKSHERYIQQGIVSYGPRLCGSNFPGVYTEIAPYMQWILDHMKP